MVKLGHEAAAVACCSLHTAASAIACMYIVLNALLSEWLRSNWGTRPLPLPAAGSLNAAAAPAIACNHTHTHTHTHTHYHTQTCVITHIVTMLVGSARTTQAYPHIWTILRTRYIREHIWSISRILSISLCPACSAHFVTLEISVCLNNHTCRTAA